MTDSLTSLPFTKWTHSSLLKFHDREWSRFLKETLDNKRISKIEKNTRIDHALEWFKTIGRVCINQELTIKK